ncbi:MAG: hypothetical protein N2109_05670 [Fimbriimonadales bacterium]|nr:hypothetical protein [Fimbriimonadales bacterium]
MTAERWKRLFRNQRWIVGDRVAPALAESEDIVVVLRSSEERAFPIKDLILATEDFLVFQGVYDGSAETAEPYKVWFCWEDILAVWDYRDPLRSDQW